MKTKKQIKEKIKSLKSQISDINNYYKHVPEYGIFVKAKNKYLEDVRPKLNEIHDEVDNLNCWAAR